MNELFADLVFSLGKKALREVLGGLDSDVKEFGRWDDECLYSYYENPSKKGDILEMRIDIQGPARKNVYAVKVKYEGRNKLSRGTMQVACGVIYIMVQCEEPLHWDFMVFKDSVEFSRTVGRYVSVTREDMMPCCGTQLLCKSRLEMDELRSIFNEFDEALPEQSPADLVV